MVCGLDFVRPLLRADGVAVQRVNHRVAPILLSGVARRQENDDVPIDGIAFQIPLERRAVYLDVLHRRRFRAGTTGGTSVVTWAATEIVSARPAVSTPQILAFMVNLFVMRILLIILKPIGEIFQGTFASAALLPATITG